MWVQSFLSQNKKACDCQYDFVQLTLFIDANEDLKKLQDYLNKYSKLATNKTVVFDIRMQEFLKKDSFMMHHHLEFLGENTEPNRDFTFAASCILNHCKRMKNGNVKVYHVDIHFLDMERDTDRMIRDELIDDIECAGTKGHEVNMLSKENLYIKNNYMDLGYIEL